MNDYYGAHVFREEKQQKPIPLFFYQNSFTNRGGKPIKLTQFELKLFYVHPLFCVYYLRSLKNQPNDLKRAIRLIPMNERSVQHARYVRNQSKCENVQAKIYLTIIQHGAAPNARHTHSPASHFLN